MPKHAASLADISAAGVRLRPIDAATIVSALVRQIENRTLPGVPSAHVIRLLPSGGVTVEGPVVATGMAVPRAAQLLADLLPRSTRSGSDTALTRVLDLARDTPPGFASLREFGEALAPFAAHDAATAVADVTARWAAAAGITDGWDPVDQDCDTSISDIRRARRATGLPLEEVSRKSRIPVSLLRQLEWGYLRNWPKGMYGRTQLARYARAAGLERQVVLDAVWPLVEQHACAPETTATATAGGESILIVQPTFKAGEVLFEAEPQEPSAPPAAALGEGTPVAPRPAHGAVSAAASAPPPAEPAAVAAPDLLYRRPDDFPILDPFASPETPRRASLIAVAALLALATAGGYWGMHAWSPDADRVTPRVVRRVPAPTEIAARRQPEGAVSVPAPPTAAPRGEVVRAAAPLLRPAVDQRVVGRVHGTPTEAGDEPEDETSASPAFASAGGVAFAEPVHAVDTGGDASRALGLRLTQVVDDHGRNYHARPSPDGSMVAFDSDREGERGVYLADAGGRNLRRVSGEGFAAIPSWAPDGRTLAFVRAEPDHPNVWNLWTLDLQSGESRRVTANVSGRPQGGSWFPDSRRIAYALGARLVVLDVVSGTLSDYSPPQPGRKPGAPAVSPDGRLIIYPLSGDGAWLTDLSDGSSRKVLSDPSAGDFTWAPDGTRVAYYSQRDREWGVWIAMAR